jgi:hypothetical protein
MFTPLWPLFQQMNLEHEFKSEVANEMNWAMRILRKADKVTWYLRYVKFNILRRMSSGTAVPEMEEVFKKLFDKMAKQMTAKSGRSVEQLSTEENEVLGRQFKEQMQHFMSLELPAFENFQFGFQSPVEIIDTFTPIERAWQAQAGKTVPYREDATIMVQFPDGSVWVDLEVNYCSEEGRAMGHCGNAADPLDEDTTLSYRTIEDIEGKRVWVPRLTFILDKETGSLGEMKGRANQKPDKKYHNVIVKLLQHPRVKGIGRGRWEVHNNFKMSDLPEDVAAKLIEEKPGLATVEYAYKVGGMTQDLLNRILKSFKDIDYPLEYEKEQKQFMIERFKSIESFVENHFKENSVTHWATKYTFGGEHLDTGTYPVDSDMKEDLLEETEKKEPGTIEKIGNYYAVKYPDEIKEWEEGQGREFEIDSASDVIMIVEEFEQYESDVSDWLEWSHWDGSEMGAQHEMYTALMKHLEYIEASTANTVVSLQFDDPDNNVRLVMHEREITSSFDEILSEVEHGGWEELLDFEDMREPQYGFQGFDEGAAVERFLEQLSELPEPETPDPSEGK